MINLFIYAYATVSTAAIITGLYFTFTNKGEK